MATWRREALSSIIGRLSEPRIFVVRDDDDNETIDASEIGQCVGMREIFRLIEDLNYGARGLI